MRLVLSTLLGLALCLPAMAQPGRGGPGGPGGFGGGNPFNPPGGRGEQPANKEMEELKATIKALEAKLKSAGERKVEVVVKEEKKEERKPEPKKPEEKKPEPKQPEGDRRPEGPPMGGRFGGGGSGGGFGGFGGFGGGPGGGGFGGLGGGQPGTPPGFDKLTKDEQATFRKLMEKMGGQPGGDRRPEGGDRRPEGDVRPMPPTPPAPDRRPEGGPRPTVLTPERREGGDRKPSMEERMEKLEKAIDEIRRGMQGPMGRGGR